MSSFCCHSFFNDDCDASLMSATGFK
ncbi:unnamed protein product [Victoria cruziana]